MAGIDEVCVDQAYCCLAHVASDLSHQVPGCGPEVGVTCQSLDLAQIAVQVELPYDV